MRFRELRVQVSGFRLQSLGAGSGKIHVLLGPTFFVT